MENQELFTLIYQLLQIGRRPLAQDIVRDMDPLDIEDLKGFLRYVGFSGDTSEKE